MTTTVDLYLRKSNKDEGRSVDRQRAELVDAAAAEGLTIGRVFVDPDLSASRYRRKDRPDFAALVEHIKSGNCAVLGIFEASRGSRDLTEWSSFLDLCRNHKVKIWVSSHRHVYDLSVRRDWKALATEGVDAADESERLSERVLSGKRQAAARGRPAGHVQYGFTRLYDGGTGRFVEQVPHPEQAPIVAEMVRRVADGEPLAQIAGDLNQRGVATPGGSQWAGRQVRQLVLRPGIAGRRVHQGQDIGAAGWKPLVDTAVWQQAVAVLHRPGRRSSTRGTALAHWLSNAARCGKCSSPMLFGISGGGRFPVLRRYRCDRCGVFVSAAALEEFVEAAVLARLQQPDALAALRPADDGALRAAEATLAALQGRLDTFYVEASQGRLSARGLAAVEAELLPQVESAAAEVRRLAAPSDLGDLTPAEVVAQWSTLPAAVKRGYVRALVDLVVMPATRRGRVFDAARLGESRWVGAARTWAEQLESLA